MYLQFLLAAVLSQTYLTTAQDPQCLHSWYIPASGRSYPLRSPDFPSNYQPGTTCHWYLYTEPGYRLNLNCNNVNMESYSGWSCRDKISVYGSNGDSFYCGTFSVNSLNHKLVLSLQSSFSSRGGSFSCTVRMIPRDCDCGWSYRTKIVGGEEVQINEFPSMAALIDARKRAPVCGATIISSSYVLTAAHCLPVLTVAATGVLVGEHDLSTGTETSATRLYRSKRFIPHPSYMPRVAKHDIALIEVTEPIQFSARVGPACLPWNRPNNADVGDYLTVLGWGTTSFGGPTSQVLMKAGIRVVPMEGCQRAFNASRPTADGQICTYEKGRDSCQMDSGGPLLKADPKVSRFFLDGIVSYGGVCAGDDPSVSSRVYAYLGWISRVTGGQENFCIK